MKIICKYKLKIKEPENDSYIIFWLFSRLFHFHEFHNQTIFFNKSDGQTVI